MAVSEYRYAGGILAQAGGIWNVQKQNMGMLEINIDQLIPGAKEVLILSLQSFRIPGRSVGQGELPYLNGIAKYPSRAAAQGNITATWRDFPLAQSRRILFQWFSLVFDETTGFMLPSGTIKTSGNLVLFQADGTGERTATLEGLWPTKMPDINIDFNTGDHMTMEMDLSCDRVIWDPNLQAPAF